MSIDSLSCLGDTIPTRFLHQAIEHPERPAYKEFYFREWVTTTWRDYVFNTVKVGSALSRLGIEASDKVCLLGFNKPEWNMTAMGAMLINAIPVGIYATSSREEIIYIINHSEAKLLLIESYRLWLSLEISTEDCPNLTLVVFMRENEADDGAQPKQMAWEKFVSQAEPSDQVGIKTRADFISGDDLAVMIYKPVTTGKSKAVMLTHHNLACMVDALVNKVQATKYDEILSYLPLSHIAEQMISLHGHACVGYCIYFAESFERLPYNLADVQPTLFFAVPRVWEKFRENMQQKISGVGRFKRYLITFAFKTGKSACQLKMRERPVSLGLRLKYFFAKRLVYSKLKRLLGLRRARLCSSGGAPISKETLEWFTQFDIPIYEIYGQSEMGGGATLNVAGAVKLGTVGKALPGVEMKIADDGEILIKSDSVFIGYYNDEKLTQSTLNDGWLYTGDIGNIDEEGYLSVTGCKKDVVITAASINITSRTTEEALL